MKVIDISDPRSPRIIGGIETGGALYGAAVANGCVCLANSWGLLQIAPTQCPGGPTPCQIMPTATPLDGGIGIFWRVPEDNAIRSIQVYRRRADENQDAWRCISPVLVVEAGEGSYIDASAEPAVSYAYLIEAVGPDGIAERFGPVIAEAGGVAAVELRIAPNPGSNRLGLSMRLPVRGSVSARILDAAGREVSWRSFGFAEAGTRHWDWQPVDLRGRELASGNYWIRVQTPAGTVQRRWAHVK